MKAMNLMGIEYTEDKIKVLREYNRHMISEISGAIYNKDSITPLEIMNIRNDYLNSLSTEDCETINDFIDAGARLRERTPIINILFGIGLLALSCTIEVFAFKIILSVLIAGLLTIELKTLANKHMYKKIMKEIKRDWGM